MREADGEIIDLNEFQRNYELWVQRTAGFLKSKVGDAEFGIVLGSGLGDLADRIQNAERIPYKSIFPFFPVPGVDGHEGTLIVGEIAGVRVFGLKGRKHYYEVADLQINAGMLQVVFPVHVLAELGVPNYFVTNAAGGLNESYNVGDMMVIRSHINFMPNPLLGRHHKFKRLDGERVWRFQPMNGAYDAVFRQLLREAGAQREGRYLAVSGPSYETDAECVAFRDGWFADAVGMSTVPEVIVARNRGMRVVGMSCITNKIGSDGTNATSHEEVKAVLEKKETRERLCSTVERFFELYREWSFAEKKRKEGEEYKKFAKKAEVIDRLLQEKEP